MQITNSQQPTPFGHEMRRNHFLIDPNYHPLNHGSYGTFPSSVRNAWHAYQDENESRPDYFFQRVHPKRIDVARRAIARLVRAPVDECVFVKNASTGTNTVLRNLIFNQADVVVYFATVYDAVYKNLASLMETTPLQIRRVEYTFPITHDEIVRRFLEVVHAAKKEGLTVRAAVFDTIVSVPGARFPFEKLTRACREEGVLSIIDGAHGVGQIPLDLGELDPDFFVTNCHKWLYTPRGSALFYVPKRNQHLLRTSFPTSHGFEPTVKDSVAAERKSAFETLFEFVATQDDTPYMCVPAALQFRAEVCGGEDSIYEYIRKIAQEGSEAVAKILGTDVMQEPGLVSSEDSDIRRCALVNVRLPLGIEDDPKNPHVPDPSTSPYALLKMKDTTQVVFWVEDKLMSEYDAYAKLFPHGGWMWLRLSGQIYLEISDFEWIGNVIAALCERVGNGEASV